MKGAARVSIGLVHWPVLDRQKKVVATNVTNFDIHDLARVARVYGLDRYFVIHRMKEQLMFVGRVLDHWRVGYGSKFNPMRRTALGMIKTVESVEAAIADFPVRPLVVATAARALEGPKRVTFKELREIIHEESDRPILIIYGTGFGLTTEALASCDYLLEPIRGSSVDDYRHLSVRSAVSISLDRLLGTW